MNIEAEVRIKNAAQLLACFMPELSQKPKQRIQLAASKKDSDLILHIKAKDPAAFRAALNSVSKMLIVSEKIKGL